MRHNNNHFTDHGEFVECRNNYIYNKYTKNDNYNKFLQHGCCVSGTFDWFISQFNNVKKDRQLYLIYFYYFISDLVFSNCLTEISKSNLDKTSTKAIFVKTHFIDNNIEKKIKIHTRGFKISSNSSESDKYETFDMNELPRPILRSYSEIENQFLGNYYPHNRTWQIISHRLFEFKDPTDPSIQNVISYTNSFVKKLDYILEPSTNIQEPSPKVNSSNEANSMKDHYAIALYMYFKIAFKNSFNSPYLPFKKALGRYFKIPFKNFFNSPCFSFKKALGLDNIDKSTRLKFFSTIFEIKVNPHIINADLTKLGELIDENLNTTKFTYRKKEIEISFKGAEKYVIIKEFVNNFYSYIFSTSNSIDSPDDLKALFKSFEQKIYNIEFNSSPILKKNFNDQKYNLKFNSGSILNNRWAVGGLLVTVIECVTYLISSLNIKHLFDSLSLIMSQDKEK